MPSLKNNQHTKSKKSSLLPHGFMAKAERISDEYRGYLNLKPHDPFSASLLTNYLNVLVKEIDGVEGVSNEIVTDLLDGFTDSFSAVTLFCPVNSRFMIVHNHSHSPARKESNLMHECAHIILKHEMEEFDNSNGFTLRNYNAVQEEEAKYLGHCLQLPKAAMNKYYVFEGKTKDAISLQFTASMQVVDYRIKICGIEKFKINYLRKRGG